MAKSKSATSRAPTRREQPRTSFARLPLPILLSLVDCWIDRLADHVAFAQLCVATYELYGHAFWRDALLRLHLGRCILQAEMNDGTAPKARARAFGFVAHARSCALKDCYGLLDHDLRDCPIPRFWEPGLDDSEGSCDEQDGDSAASDGDGSAVRKSETGSDRPASEGPSDASSTLGPPDCFSAAAEHLEWPFWAPIEDAGFREDVGPNQFYVELRPITEHVIAASAFATNPPVYNIAFFESFGEINVDVSNWSGVTLYDMVSRMSEEIGPHVRRRYKKLFADYRRRVKAELRRRDHNKRNARFEARRKHDAHARRSDTESEDELGPVDTSQDIYVLEDRILACTFEHMEISLYDEELVSIEDFELWLECSDVTFLSTRVLRRVR